MISEKNSVCKPRVMLINPPQTYFEKSGGFNVYFPIGLLSLAAAVKDKCELKILDCLVEKFRISKRRNKTIYGSPPKDIERAIRNFKPDIIGISCPFSSQLENSIKVANLCKEINPKVLVVFGGPDASVRSEFILSQNSSIDVCVVGEGEYTFLEIVDNFKNGRLVNQQSIKGIICRNGGKIIRNKDRDYIKDLDKFPFPAYELIKFEKYFDHLYLYAGRSKINEKSISMITSRGCPYKCVFCSIHLHMGKVFRAHSPEYVLRHIKLLVEKYGIENFHFEDDNISLDRRRFRNILDGIIQSNLDISWDTPNGIRADTLDFNLLKKAKKSGCKSLRIGIESGNQKVLDKIINKNLSLKKVIKVAQWCRKLAIDLAAFYVIGFPGETIVNMKETIDFALSLYRRYCVYPFLMIATPLYGTKLYEICEKNNFFSAPITEENLSRATQLWGKHLIKTNDFSEKDIDELIRYFLFEIAMIDKITNIKRHLTHEGL